MTGFIVIIIGFAIAFWLEAWHDYTQAQTEAALRNCRKVTGREDLIPIDEKRKQRWHTASLWYTITIALTVSIVYLGLTYQIIYMMFLIGTLRELVFVIRLNILLGVDWYYLGGGRFDNFFKKLGKWYFILNGFTFILMSLYFINNLTHIL